MASVEKQVTPLWPFHRLFFCFSCGDCKVLTFSNADSEGVERRLEAFGKDTQRIAGRLDGIVVSDRCARCAFDGVYELSAECLRNRSLVAWRLCEYLRLAACAFDSNVGVAKSHSESDAAAEKNSEDMVRGVESAIERHCAFGDTERTKSSVCEVSWWWKATVEKLFDVKRLFGSVKGLDQNDGDEVPESIDVLERLALDDKE